MVKSQVLSVHIEAAPEYPLAPEYERVHFVGTALFNIGITEELLNAQADEMMSKLEEKVGYRVFLVDIKVTPHGLWTDVDFIMDVPYGYEQSPQVLTLAAAMSFIVTVLPWIILGLIIVWVFWTTWIDKLKLYYCDQCPGFPSFEGYNSYLAHLAAFHPKKYEAASEEPWWEKLAGLGKYIPWVVGGLVGLALINAVASAASRPPRPEKRD